jgi:hypothetical protein
MQCTFSSAKSLLPYVFSRLVSLTLVDTINAQALYLLRVVTPGGILPRLRSLGIQLIASSDSSHDVRLEGNQYYGDHKGRVLETNGTRGTSRYFDANYLAILAKAVSGIEELELLGHSKISIVSFFYMFRNSLPYFNLLQRICSHLRCSISVGYIH